MKVIILQELKVYSVSYLCSVFSVDKVKLNQIMNSFLLKNIVRMSNRQKEFRFNDIEITEQDDLLSNEGETYCFKFVGILLYCNICLIFYPKYINNYEQDKNNKYFKLKQLIAVIRKYKSKGQKLGELNKEESLATNSLDIAVDLISDYFVHGLYCNDSQLISQNVEGEIFWDKTINESQVYFSNGIPYYLDSYKMNQKIDFCNFFSRLHCAVLTEISDNLKDILDILDFEKIKLTSEKVNSFGNIEYILYRINKELVGQFVTYKQNILKLLKKYFEFKYSKSITGYISFLGTNSFNLVWEDVCSVVMGDCLHKPIIELGLKYKANKKESLLLLDVISKPKWVHNKSKVEHQVNYTLVPDIVTIKDNNMSIYDAKYYNIVFDDKEIRNQPGVADITKQYLYELAYKKFAIENALNIDKNVFLMPSDKNCEDITLGIASIDLFDVIDNFKLNKIQIILKACNRMYTKYLQ